MQKVAKGFLLVVSGVIALALLGTIAINLYVQSARTRSRIERELTASLRLPVRMTGITLTPWHGLKISGIAVQQPAGGTGSGNFLEASSFTAFFKWTPLLRHQLVVDEIAINDPKVAWFQNENGKWQLPSEEPPAKRETGPKPPKEPPEKDAERQKEKPEKPLEISLNRLQIKRGSFAFLDQHSKPVAVFSDVEVACPNVSAEITQGDATSGKVSIHDALLLDDVHIPFTFASGDLTLRGVNANLAHGELHGDFQIQTDEKHSPFSADASFDHVDLNRLLIDAGLLPGRAAGQLAGWIDLYGNAGKPDTLGGRGQVALTGGQIQQNEFFQLLGQALQIDELSQLRLQQAQADFRVAEGFVWVDRLNLQSPNLQLQASGTVRLDGKLKLDARLTINERVSRQLPNFVEANFQRSPDEPDLRFINFPIAGTINKPQTDLMERILGRKIEREMGSLLQNLFTKPKKDKKKKPGSTAAESSTPKPAAPGAVPVPPSSPEPAETPEAAE